MTADRWQTKENAERRPAIAGPRTFANVVVTPDAVEGLSPEPVRDLLDGDPGLVRNWRLSNFSTLPDGKDTTYSDMPAGSQECMAGLCPSRTGP